MAARRALSCGRSAGAGAPGGAQRSEGQRRGGVQLDDPRREVDVEHDVCRQELETTQSLACLFSRVPGRSYFTRHHVGRHGQNRQAPSAVPRGWEAAEGVQQTGVTRRKYGEESTAICEMRHNKAAFRYQGARG